MAPPYDVRIFDRQALNDAIKSSFMTRAQVESADGVRYLFDYLDHLGARTMVVEYDYIDGDYLDDFATYYVKSFTRYERTCRRLHFFDGAFHEALLLDAVRGSVPPASLGRYLGFVVFGKSAPTPAEITRAANRAVFNARPLPSRGLSLSQIARAVREFGLEPEVIECTAGVPLVSLLQSYLAFGLPVILGIEIDGVGLHAVTVTGYSLRGDRCLPLEDVYGNAQQLYRIGLRIDELYAHDDGVGPFARMAVRVSGTPDPGKSVVYFEGGWKDPAMGQPRKLTPLWALVPVYHKIRLTYLDLQQWVTQVNAVTQVGIARPGDVEWAIQLSTTSAYKESIKSAATLPTDIVERMLFEQQPKFLWRATMNLGGAPAMELLFDATGMMRSLPLLEILYHDPAFKAHVAPIFSHPGLTNVVDEQLAERLRDSVTT